MQTKLARVSPGTSIRIGTTEQGKPIKSKIVTQLSQLPSRESQEPFMGQEKGVPPRINRFRRAGAGEGARMRGNLRRLAEKRAKGAPVDEAALRSQQVKASLVEEREKRDNTKRADAASELIAQLPPVARRTRLRGR